MPKRISVLSAMWLLMLSSVTIAEDWRQFQGDGRHAGNAADRTIVTPLKLAGAAKLTDAIFTAPVVADGRVYAVDGSGVAFCFDAITLKELWRFQSRGGAENCNNLSSPALVEGYLHFGAMAGVYYVLDAATGKIVRQIECGEPVFSTPVAMNARVYFVTLGSVVHAIKPDGTLCWTWDYLAKQTDGKFTGDRYSGKEWLERKQQRVTWRDQFFTSRDMAGDGKNLVISMGGETVWLADAGDHGELRANQIIPAYAGNQRPGIFGQCVAEDSTVYTQWHRRDNTGRLEIQRLKDGKILSDHVPGTIIARDTAGSLSVCAPSVRGTEVYHCRPEAGFGLARYVPGVEKAQILAPAASIAPPVLLRDCAVYGGLDGKLHVAPLSGKGPVWSFATAFGKPISAPPAVCDGRVFFGCEDGYLYALSADGAATLPAEDPGLWKIRSPLAGPRADAKFDWFTNFGDFANSNSREQGVRPPLALKWIRRYEGTFKHIAVCGGGRMYTHTAEGQIFAVEQDTGRLLWRRFFPGVHVSYTAPMYHDGKLIVPQAGLEGSFVRCLDAATGNLLWEAPFTGSPSWGRHQPPIVWKNLVIYQFSTGKYVPKGTGIYVFRQGPPKELPASTDGEVSWLFSNDVPFFPKEHHPIVRAWDLSTGKEVWNRDFSEHGAGGDHAGLALMDDTIFYSVFFGYAAKDAAGKPTARGLTAALEPATGKTKWLTTKYSVTAGCTVSAADGRLYMGGYNPPDVSTQKRYVWCLDAKDGSLVWQSDPVVKSINTITIGPREVFAYAYGGDGAIIDKATGKINWKFNYKYACTRFTMSPPYLLSANMDLIEFKEGARIVSSGPPVDPRECAGSVASNGRIFFTAQASGMQASQLCGPEAENFVAVWRRSASK